MIFRQTYNKLNKIRDSLYSDTEYDISSHDFFYSLLKKKKIKKNYNKLFSLTSHLILMLLSYATILKARAIGIKKFNYFIITDKNIIDTRSNNILNKLNYAEYLNCVRTKDFITSIKVYFKLKNIIFYHSLFFYYDFRSFFLTSNKNKLLRIHSKNIYKYYTLKKIFSFLKLKKFIMIDDYREMQIFIKICRELNIQSLGYQHSRFNKYIFALKYGCFDKYIVWTPFFKKKLLSLNKDYKKKIIVNNFRKFLVDKNINKNNNLIYFVDDFVDTKKIILYLSKLNKLKNYNLFIKLKNNSFMSEKFINFLETYKFKILPNKPIKYLVKEFKPSVFMAAHSNVLIESSLYNAIPVLLKTSADYSFDLVREKLVFYLNLNDNFEKKIDYFIKRKKLISSFRKRIWNCKNEKINHFF